MRYIYDKSLVRQEDISSYGEKLTSYVEFLRSVLQNGYESYESFINLPGDKELLDLVADVVRDKSTPELAYVIVVGIGGSNVGAQAIYNALYGHIDNLEPERLPKMIFADTSDPETIEAILSFIENKITRPEEFVVNIISKSGDTMETMVNAELIVSALEKKSTIVSDRIIVTTSTGSKLWTSADKKGITCLSIPKMVGGRFSVFSATGLLPLALCGINIIALLEGARDMRTICLIDNIYDNPAMLSSSVLYHSYKNGYIINDNFLFHPEFEYIGKWYRQLMGESLGKREDIDGNIVNIGITPTVSIGSTDLHSVAQLYLGEPKNKITTFIATDDKTPYGDTVPDSVFFDTNERLGGKTLSEIMKSIFEGTKKAYEKYSLPFMEVYLDDISAKEVGAFMQFKMIEILYLGKLLRVNPFDQPEVESYKEEARKNISK